MPEHLKRSLPFYNGLGFFARNDETKGFKTGQVVVNPHPGLVFDKYIDTWDINHNGRSLLNDPGRKNDHPKRKLGSKRAWLDETVEEYEQAKETLDKPLKSYLSRQRSLTNALGGICLEVKTDWRFVSGLGNAHPLETGFIWHRTLGVPYLPGSSVKGLIRAWSDPKNGEGWGDEDEWQTVKSLFGDMKNDGAGALIVFDALPARCPTLEVDIMNPHYGEYYKGNEPPADYLSPKPVHFLAVAAQESFCFFVAPRPDQRKLRRDNSEWHVTQGMELLEQALNTLGAGAKTAVGYGTMQVDEAEMAQREREVKKRAEEQKKLVANAARAAELAALSTQQRRIEELRERLAEAGVKTMHDKKDALLRDTAALLKDARRWSVEDRVAAAGICVTIYDELGWGSQGTQAKRRDMINALTGN